jgi:hypothetical protein
MQSFQDKANPPPTKDATKEFTKYFSFTTSHASSSATGVNHSVSSLYTCRSRNENCIAVVRNARGNDSLLRASV